jgi:protein-S-isoprenylcysteine O-methyltransferase Ste14
VKELVFFFMVFYGLERLVWKLFGSGRRLMGILLARYTLYLLVSANIIVFVLAVSNCFSPSMLGLAPVVAAMVCRNWSIATLGPYHSIHIEVRKEHPLITSGPYQYVRNPYYVSNALELVGFPIVAHAQLALLFSLVVYMPALLLRLLLEERALKAKFGASYCRYATTVPRLFLRL